MTPTSHDYGDEVVGRSHSYGFEIQSVGDGYLDVSSIALAGDNPADFSIYSGGDPVMLAPGDSQRVVVTFRPTGIGPKNAILLVESNDPDTGENPLDLTLTGQGVAPGIAITPTAVDFDAVRVGSDSASTITIRNEGNLDLDITDMAIAGSEAADFSLEGGGTPFLLPPGDSVDVVVRFTPLVVGPKDASLSVTSNDPWGPVTELALHGAGVYSAAPVVFEESASGGSMGSASVTASGLSGGGGTYLAAISSRYHVDVSSVTGLGATWSRLEEQCGGRGQTGVEVWAATGATSGNAVTATFEEAPASAVIVVARYSGGDPNDPFGTVSSKNTKGVQGSCSGGSDSKDYRLDLDASSDDAIVFGAVAKRQRIHHAGSGWSTRDEASIAAGGNTTGISVVDQFIETPGEVRLAGSFSSTADWAVIGVEIRGGSGDSPDITAVPGTFDFGAMDVGVTSTTTFQLRNDGTTDLIVDAPTLTGSDASEFVIVSGGEAFTLAPGRIRTIGVLFAPTTGGAKSASLRLVSNDPNESPFDVALAGEGITFPEIAASPSNHAYGDVVVDSSRSQEFQIRNVGVADLQVSAVTLGGASPGEFRIDGGDGSFTIAPGDSHRVDVSFRPTTVGPKGALLQIDSNDPDPADDPLDVPLTGIGLAPTPDIVMTPASFDFGDVAIAAPPGLRAGSPGMFEITNEGLADLQVSAVTLEGPDAADFELVTSGGFTLAPGDTQWVEVSFQPQSIGPKAATLRIVSDDPDESPADAALTGNGVDAPQPDIASTPTAHNFGAVLVGAAASHSFEIGNTGGGDLVVTSTSLAGPYADEFHVTGGGSFTLLPGETRNVTVDFIPVTPGLKTATLDLASNAPGETVLGVGLSGTGITPPPPDEIAFEESTTGSSSGDDTVVSGSLSESVTGADDFYLAAVSSKGFEIVESVVGLGLTWTLVREQCGAREQTGMTVFRASGPSSGGTVTATFTAAPAVGVIAVCRYSGVDPSSPGAVVSGNTRGPDGSCSGGSDGTSYSFELGTTTDGAVVYSAVGLRRRTHTPGAGYTERLDFYHGNGSTAAGIAVQDRAVGTPTTVDVDGTFNQDVDWSLVALELLPAAADSVPAIALVPGSHDFGEVPQFGVGVPCTLLVGNAGLAALSVDGMTLVGSDAAEFSIEEGDAPFTLLPGETHDVVVTFAPTSEGTKNATLRLTSNDPSENPFDVSLSGTGVAMPPPTIAVTPLSHDYGIVPLGAPALQAFEIRNDGPGTLTVTATELAGGDTASFSIEAGGGPFSLEPGETHDVTISFGPTAVGNAGTTFRVTSNDPVQPQLDVLLTGEGSDEPEDIVLKETASGASSSSTVTTDSDVSAATRDFYIAVVGSKPYLPSTDVSGLGVTWTLVLSQCGAREQTGLDVWRANGTPTGDGPVSATLDSDPNSAVIVVSRYSGVHETDPIGASVSGNTRGEFGSCSGGSDDSQYSLDLATTTEAAVVFAAAAMRDKSHTPGTGWTEHVEIEYGSAGTAASLATMDQKFDTPTSFVVDGEFSGVVDYAVAALELRPGSAVIASPTPEPSGNVRAVHLAPSRPNPFRTETTVEYVLPEPTRVEIVIYDAAGRVVRRLVNGPRSAGVQLVRWRGDNESGTRVGSGVYFLRLEAGPETRLRKLILRR